MLRALRRLGARYDGAAMVPPDAAFAAQAASAAEWPAWRALHAWCLAGSSPLSTRLAVAVLEGGDNISAHAIAQALCLERDGSLQLLACRGAAGRVALRLKTKLHDVTPGRRRQPADAWDAGFLHGNAAGLQALAHFEPRRATLLVAHGLPLPALRATCALLHTRQRHYRQAVRLLLLCAAPGLAVGQPVTRIALRATGTADPSADQAADQAADRSPDTSPA